MVQECIVWNHVSTKHLNWWTQRGSFDKRKDQILVQQLPLNSGVGIGVITLKLWFIALKQSLGLPERELVTHKQENGALWGRWSGWEHTWLWLETRPHALEVVIANNSDLDAVTQFDITGLELVSSHLVSFQSAFSGECGGVCLVTCRSRGGEGGHTFPTSRQLFYVCYWIPNSLVHHICLQNYTTSILCLVY